MKKFEYMKKNVANTFHLDTVKGTFDEWLNERGKEGWELVTIIQNPFRIRSYDCYFKREIK